MGDSKIKLLVQMLNSKRPTLQTLRQFLVMLSTFVLYSWLILFRFLVLLCREKKFSFVASVSLLLVIFHGLFCFRSV